MDIMSELRKAIGHFLSMPTHLQYTVMKYTNIFECVNFGNSHHEAVANYFEIEKETRQTDRFIHEVHVVMTETGRYETLH